MTLYFGYQAPPLHLKFNYFLYNPKRALLWECFLSASSGALARLKCFHRMAY